MSAPSSSSTTPVANLAERERAALQWAQLQKEEKSSEVSFTAPLAMSFLSSLCLSCLFLVFLPLLSACVAVVFSLQLALWTDRWDHERQEALPHAGTEHVRIVWRMSRDERECVWGVLGRYDALVSLQLGGDSGYAGVECPMELDDLSLLLSDCPLPLEHVRLLFLQRISSLNDGWLRALSQVGCGPSLTSLTLSCECVALALLLPCSRGRLAACFSPLALCASVSVRVCGTPPWGNGPCDGSFTPCLALRAGRHQASTLNQTSQRRRPASHDGRRASRAVTRRVRAQRDIADS